MTFCTRSSLTVQVSQRAKRSHVHTPAGGLVAGSRRASCDTCRCFVYPFSVIVTHEKKKKKKSSVFVSHLYPLHKTGFERAGSFRKIQDVHVDCVTYRPQGESIGTTFFMCVFIIIMIFITIFCCCVISSRLEALHGSVN